MFPHALRSSFCFAGDAAGESSRGLEDTERFGDLGRGSVGIWFADAEERLW